MLYEELLLLGHWSWKSLGSALSLWLILSISMVLLLGFLYGLENIVYLFRVISEGMYFCAGITFMRIIVSVPLTESSSYSWLCLPEHGWLQLSLGSLWLFNLLLAFVSWVSRLLFLVFRWNLLWTRIILTGNLYQFGSRARNYEFLSMFSAVKAQVVRTGLRKTKRFDNPRVISG